jgi:uncharacterized protein YqeY
MPSDKDSLRDRMRGALTAAMKDRNVLAVSVLRTSLGAIDNAESVGVPRLSGVGEGPIAGAVTGLGAGEATRRNLSEDQIRAIVLAEVSDRKSAATHYQELSQHEDAARLRAEITILRALLDDG